MSTLTLCAIFGLSTVGAVVQALCGSGYGPLSMSVLPYILPYFQAVALTGLCGTTTALIVAVTNFRHINWRLVIPCEILGIPTAVTSAYLAAVIPAKVMVPCMGAALAALGIYSIFFSDKIHIKATTRNGMIAGAIAGVCSGLFSVGGAPMAVYMVEAAQDKDEYRASINAHFSISTLVTTITRWYNGAFTPPILHAYGLMVISLFLGAWLGNKIFQRLNAKRLRLLVYSYLILSGILMLLR